ncbi:MAG: hypothetical protein JXC33_08430 [Deltaproteobacteria bacterium]|nr:hypothetical protein [Deltaproteobacteria bacterium]
MKIEKNKKSWSIFIIGDKRQHSSFEITKKFLVSFVVMVGALTVLIPALFWFHNRSLITVQKELVDKITETQNLLTCSLQTNAELSRKNEELEEALSSTFKNTSIAKSESPVGPIDDFNHMTVENLQMSIDKATDMLYCTFLLRSNKRDNVPISGYIFVILKPDYLNSMSWKGYPQRILKEGILQDFTKGERFTIARFKTIRSKLRNISEQSGSAFISILVFSGDGKLILIKDFYIKTFGSEDT